MTEKIHFERDGAVARLTITRPEKNNCIDFAVLDGIEGAIEEVSEDPSIKLLTLRGAESIFSAGADLEMFYGAVKDDDRETVRRLIDTFHRVTHRLEALEVPTLGVIEGFAFAGALELLLSLDLRIATEDATIGDQHANIGIVPGGGNTQRLTRQIPVCHAKELIFTGKRIDGTQAAEWGLVNTAVPSEEIDDVVESYEAQLAEKSRDAAALTKELVNSGLETDRRTALELERRGVLEHYFSADAREGFQAFTEGREPKF